MSRPIVITGMHRSGTSMVARAAQSLGLWLGHPDELVPGAPDNPDGFFEHAGLVAANDALFQHLGAGWDCPPVLGADDLGQPGLETARELARPVIAELAEHGSWAWKDPRVAPVLPFWLDLVPGAGTVLCVRNPLEVAASLRARNGTSLALGLRLWFTHMDAALAAAPARLVTHYDAWFQRPEEEVARFVAFAGMTADDGQRAAAASVPARHRRHARFDAAALRTARVHAELRGLYDRLRAEAGWDDGSPLDTAPRNPACGATPPAAVGQVQPWVVDVGLAHYEVHKRNGRVTQLEQRLAEATSTTTSASSVVDLQAAIYDLQLGVAELMARLANGIDAEARARDVAYARMIRGVRAEVLRLVDVADEVLVLSDGEPALVDLHGRVARHFPVGTEGPGPRPANGVAACAHLVARQALGATHLVVPWTASWWLTSYPELADRLTTAATVASQFADGTTIHRLHGPIATDRSATVTAALAAARPRLGDEPSVLDATERGLDLPGTFRPPDRTAALPYLDASVDVVIVDAEHGDMGRAEAHRVAAHGVLAGDADGWMWTWTGPPATLAADLVLAAAPLANPGAYVDVLLGSVPPGWRGDLVVVAPAGAVDAWRRAVGDRAEVLSGRVGAALAEVVTRSANEHVVLVDGTAIPLGGWLPSLLAPFAGGSTVGLVAGRRRMAAGSPVLAAHAIAGDGLQPAIGVEGDHLTRPIDIAVPGLAAWRRDVLGERGLDERFESLDFTLADHCWALAASDRECLVQPEAETVDLGLGGTAPSTLTADRHRFDGVWAAAP